METLLAQNLFGCYVWVTAHTFSVPRLLCCAGMSNLETTSGVGREMLCIYARIRSRMPDSLACTIKIALHFGCGVFPSLTEFPFSASLETDDSPKKDWAVNGA